MKVKSRNMLRVPGWFNQEKKAVRSRITHKIYRSFAPVLISIKISNTRIIDSKIELPFNQFAIWLMREQIVTESIWRPSHPSRVRGLKISLSSSFALNFKSRTLHGCVDWKWLSQWLSCKKIWVAPFTGAWIENWKAFWSINQHMICRTLHGCVDWKFLLPVIRARTRTSHPSRVRGLKKNIILPFNTTENSRTLHGCVDWKPLPAPPFLRQADVAPFTGAWIENAIIIERSISISQVAPFTGAWIEKTDFFAILLMTVCRTLHGCVDWKAAGVAHVDQPVAGRTLHGCVDWKLVAQGIFLGDFSVAPFTGAWIENYE